MDDTGVRSRHAVHIPEGAEDMPAARRTRKGTGAERDDQPTTPHKKRPSSGNVTHRWLVELDPFPLDIAPSAWNSDLLDALLAEWTKSQMARVQQWVTIHGSEEMKVTLQTLSTANATRRSLHSGFRSLVRGAQVRPLIFSAHMPKNTTFSSRSTALKGHRTTRP